MHLPDGFLDARTALAAAALSAAGLGFAVRELRATLPPRRVPLLGLTAAFVFATQMINFPVAAGTSGHLMGGVLAAVLLGPAAAVLIMSAVLIVQCLLFADGGLLALGANVFNTALVATCAGHGAYRLLLRLFRSEHDRAVLFAASFAAWLGTIAGSVSCAGQLALSGTVPWRLAFPAMAGIHMVIGVGEALITALVLRSVLRLRPELVAGREAAAESGWRAQVVLGLLVAAGLVLFVAPFASPLPDGLERVAARLGFEGRAQPPALPAPFPDYAFAGLTTSPFAAAIAGLVGTAIAFAAAWGLARLLVPGFRARPGSDAASSR